MSRDLKITKHTFLLQAEFTSSPISLPITPTLAWNPFPISRSRPELIDVCLVELSADNVNGRKVASAYSIGNDHANPIGIGVSVWIVLTIGSWSISCMCSAIQSKNALPSNARTLLSIL